MTGPPALAVVPRYGLAVASVATALRAENKGAEGIVLDLEEVTTLVDLDVVRFPGVLRATGVELVSYPPYIRDWIFTELNP